MEPGALKILLMLLLPAVILGAPLAVGIFILWTWMKRSNRAVASKPFLGAAICGAVSFLSMIGAVSLLVAIAVKEEHHPDYFDDHPLLPLLMIGLGLLAVATAFVGALCAVWMVWRLIAARAAAAPARSAG